MTYKIVFEGKIAGGQKAEDVRNNLISLFKASAAQIERLFSKSPVVVRKGVNHATALKYQQALKKAGALCKIVREKSSEAAVSRTMPGNDAVLGDKSANRMSCPRCTYEQAKAEECVQCGTVIRKYREVLNKTPAPISMPAPSFARSRPAKSRLKIVWIAVVLVVLLLAYFAFGPGGDSRPITHGPGIIAPNPPAQEMIESGQQFSHKDYLVTPLATFRIEARVLSSKHYRSGRESDLSPVDLALGWGAMSDETVLEKIKIRQSNRFYYWKVKKFPIPRRDIEQNSANMHLIPADNEIAKIIKKVRAGHVVEIEGYLVKVQARDGWRWKSSLTRKDTGHGACEVIWVEDISVNAL
jgi:hypothetical protein